MATSVSVVRLARLLYCAILVINMPLIWWIWLSSAVPGWLKQGELPGFCGRMRCTRRSPHASRRCVAERHRWPRLRFQRPASRLTRRAISLVSQKSRAFSEALRIFDDPRAILFEGELRCPLTQTIGACVPCGSRTPTCEGIADVGALPRAGACSGNRQSIIGHYRFVYKERCGVSTRRAGR